MRQIITGVAWWLVLTSPVIGWGLYEWITHPHHHPDTGPHGGVIVEWDASHETVAEVVLDRQCGVVAVYVLDRWAKRPRPLPAQTLTLTLATPTSSVVQLVSVPPGGNPPGWSSQFSSGRVLKSGDESKLAGTLSVMANGWQLTGNFGGNEDRR
jgi:hypothetical protein